jgi:hypothetical protein
VKPFFIKNFLLFNTFNILFLNALDTIIFLAVGKLLGLFLSVEFTIIFLGACNLLDSLVLFLRELYHFVDIFINNYIDIKLLYEMINDDLKSIGLMNANIEIILSEIKK